MKGQEWYQADDVAEEYDDKRFSRGGQLIDRREKEAVLEAIMPVEDQKVLEIACGTGRFTVMLAHQGADVVGLDISAAMLQQGRRKAQNTELAGTLEFLRGDAGRLPFPDDHFDTVIAMRFFHLADDPEAFLEEMRRVSRDQIVFDTFNRFSARSIYNWALPMGSRLYSKSEIAVLLAKTDLTLVDVEDDFLLPYGLYRSIPNSLASPLRTLDKAISELPTTDHVASVSYWNARVR
ncbi:class I SAM-dependent methyltransferase [Natrinema hispanicum]|uniref:Methyltransferase domain-containing protein n=1 Tax=Natrinema hispanicum TaxID=392421 RepID=A0A1I0I3P8_9EURY|nr:class I SAM-dependent methyltransferase [Natrinema hispanicum]SDD21439.1 Methyltransferase domain-containing protein [Natrinema hispanicum]SET91217.1 Methyltransferase domain-containing protein [Natrinema hispanicum]